MARSSRIYQVAIAIVLGNLLSLGLGVGPGFTDSDDGENLSQGLPGRRIGGGTRGPEASFDSDQHPLTALVPENNLSVVTAAHPNLLFYVPPADGPQKVEFVLRNAADELVYDKTFRMSAQGGMVSMGLTDTDEFPQLAANQNYQWYLSVMAEDRARDVSVDGWVRRVELDDWLAQQGLEQGLSARIAAASGLELAKLLSQEVDLWSEAVLVVNELRLSQPTNLAVLDEWEALLETVGLESIGQEISAGVFLARH
ncbi:MAG: DUF928 domain-containing protein [Cyanobacteria bacterium P01_A01_bin.114]